MCLQVSSTHKLRSQDGNLFLGQATQDVGSGCLACLAAFVEAEAVAGSKNTLVHFLVSVATLEGSVVFLKA